MIPIDDVVFFDVTTHHPSTGAVTDADSGPTYDVFEEGTDTPILDDQTLTKRTSLTGNYRGSFTASAANGFEAGKWYSVIATATVNAITAKMRAMHFRIAPAETVAGVPKVDPSTWDGTDITTGVPLAPTTAGRTLDVSAGGEAGIDWANIGSPTTAQNLSATNIDVDQIVASVSGNVGGNVTGSIGSLAAQAKADVNAEVDTALVDVRLDELVAADSDIDGAAPPTVGSVFHELLTKTVGSFTYDQTTDSLEAVRDNTGTAGAGLTNIDLPNQTMDITGNITGNLSGSVGSVTGAVGSVAAGGITAASIAAGAIDADALAADAVDEILDEQIGDGTITMRQALRVLIAGMAGKLSGAATTTVTIRNTADSANVIVATVDADGNRSTVTVTP